MYSEASIKSEIRISHDLSGIPNLRIRDISRNSENIVFYGRQTVDIRRERGMTI